MVIPPYAGVADDRRRTFTEGAAGHTCRTLIYIYILFVQYRVRPSRTLTIFDDDDPGLWRRNRPRGRGSKLYIVLLRYEVHEKMYDRKSMIKNIRVENQ